MLFAPIEDRFRRALGDRNTAERSDSISFAVYFTRLLVRVLPESVSRAAHLALTGSLAARTDLAPGEIALLLELALAPENRTLIDEHELFAFGSRFGKAEEKALRSSVADDISLSAFVDRYGSAEAILLLDALFQVSGTDGLIDRDEVIDLQRFAAELGVDDRLVGLMFRKHDPRHEQGNLEYPLTLERMVIGRAPSADIYLPDPQVALRHAELIRSIGGEKPEWRIVDLNSGRPMVVNGQAVGASPLRAGDVLKLGPYQLSLDSTHTNVRVFGTNVLTSLSVRHLQRTVDQTVLLDDVSFTVFSGELVAVVGPSGSGKTTLLSAITGTAPADSGNVLYDGHDFHSQLAIDRSLVGIVPQDDVVLPDLSVQENLQYSGRLRFPKDVSNEAIAREVDRVLDELSISHVRKSRIGDAIRRGVSGGQRKRVSLGQELLTQSTRVLFLDEPTSGLDPQTAQEIIRLVRQIADNGRTLFVVTHDVTPTVMSMVDHLLVLAPGGRLAWFGPPSEACAFFGVKSADDIFGYLSGHRPEELGKRYRESDAYRKYVRTREHVLGLGAIAPTRSPTLARAASGGLPPNDPPHPGPQGGEAIAQPTAAGSKAFSSWLQYRTLTKRYWVSKLRDRTGTAVLLTQAPILAIAMKIVFPEPDAATMFMLALSALWFGASGSVRELISDRTIWRREARVGVRVLPYIGSKVTVLGTIAIVQATLLTGLNWWMLDMGRYGFSLPLLTLVTSMTGLVGMSLGLWMSSIFNSSEAAVGTLPLLLIPQITFGGLIVKVKEMSALSKFVSYGMITRYAFDATIKSGDRLSRAGAYGTTREDIQVTGVLYDLGLRSSSAADMGIPLAWLLGILMVFFMSFLVLATMFTRRSENH